MGLALMLLALGTGLAARVVEERSGAYMSTVSFRLYRALRGPWKD
jgi:hypothetical protein